MRLPTRPFIVAPLAAALLALLAAPATGATTPARASAAAGAPSPERQVVTRWVDGTLERWTEIHTAAGVLVEPAVGAPDHAAPPTARARLAQQARAGAETPGRSVRRGVERPRTAVRERLASPLVFGQDDRQRVIDTSEFPFSTMTFVVSEFPNGDLLAFSGFLVSPYVVLTSAQALYQQSLGGFVVSVEVFPGQTQPTPNADPTAPFGSEFGVEVEVPQDWVDFEPSDANYGAIFLDRAFAGITTFLPLVFDLTPPARANLAGYDLISIITPSLALWTRSGNTDGADTSFVFHLLDDDEGAIGAPLWDNSMRVFAVDCCEASDGSANVGVRLTSANRSLIEGWLAFEPAGTGLEPDGSPLLLVGGRYEIRVAWRDAAGATGDGTPVPLTADTGYFWFFNQENVELVIKVLDGCGISNTKWVFAGGLTDVEVEIEVLDTVGAQTKRYSNRQGVPFQPITDTAAFATCP